MKLFEKAVQWKPNEIYCEFIDEKYINHQTGYDSYGVEYTICDVGIHSFGNFVHIKPNDYIVTLFNGRKVVFSEEEYKVYNENL